MSRRSFTSRMSSSVMRCLLSFLSMAKIPTGLPFLPSSAPMMKETERNALMSAHGFLRRYVAGICCGLSFVPASRMRTFPSAYDQYSAPESGEIGARMSPTGSSRLPRASTQRNIPAASSAIRRLTRSNSKTSVATSATNR